MGKKLMCFSTMLITFFSFNLIIKAGLYCQFDNKEDCERHNKVSQDYWYCTWVKNRKGTEWCAVDCARLPKTSCDTLNATDNETGNTLHVCIWSEGKCVYNLKDDRVMKDTSCNKLNQYICQQFTACRFEQNNTCRRLCVYNTNESSCSSDYCEWNGEKCIEKCNKIKDKNFCLNREMNPHCKWDETKNVCTVLETKTEVECEELAEDKCSGKCQWDKEENICLKNKTKTEVECEKLTEDKCTGKCQWNRNNKSCESIDKIENIIDSEYNNYDLEESSCGNKLITNIPKSFLKIIRIIYLMIQVMVPVVLVILGTIDLFKGITVQKEEEIKKGQQIFLKRLISAALIFFVLLIVKLAVGFAADSNSGRIIGCAECFINGECD